MITCKNDRLLELLWFVGYCIEFPTQLAVRIGGGPEWNRRVMYRAIHEGYVKLYRRKYMSSSAICLKHGVCNAHSTMPSVTILRLGKTASL